MSEQTPLDFLELPPVRFRADGVGEWDDSRFSVFVPRDRIQRISLDYGFQCERPLVAGIFGTAVSSVGVFGVVIVLGWLFQGGVISKYLAMLPVCALVGGWMLKSALSRGYFLRIECGSDRRKIAFRSNALRKEIESFLTDVEQQTDYRVERIDS